MTAQRIFDNLVMDIQFFCPRWGSEHLSWDSFCNKVKAAGFNGIEAGVPFDNNTVKEMSAALEKYGLSLVGQYWQSFEKDFDAHASSYEKHLLQNVLLNPVKIDAQTGKDYFSFEQNQQLFEIAARITVTTGVTIAHETHRNKALFAAHVTRQFLEKIPSLTITADLSHWCNVAESFLEDQQEVLALLPKHTIHIHARVGHPQSAQVIDPRMPQYAEALNHHVQWWKSIIDYHREKNATVFTITPEFGPAPYMLHSPETGLPLADQWEINCWMMNYLKELFSR